eukprot:1157570-Pelagomonas_calceolata.AAC.10
MHPCPCASAHLDSALLPRLLLCREVGGAKGALPKECARLIILPAVGIAVGGQDPGPSCLPCLVASHLMHRAEPWGAGQAGAWQRRHTPLLASATVAMSDVRGKSAGCVKPITHHLLCGIGLEGQYQLDFTMGLAFLGDDGEGELVLAS